MTLIPYLPFLFEVDKYLLAFLVILTAIFIYYHKKSRLLDYFAALILSMSLSEFMKYLINEPRPISQFFFEGSGFPSTHSAVAAATVIFYVLICHPSPKSMKEAGERIKKGLFTKEGLKSILVILIGFAVMWLRVILKAHEWEDVFAGIIIGFLITLIFMFYDIQTRRIK